MTEPAGRRHPRNRWSRSPEAAVKEMAAPVIGLAPTSPLITPPPVVVIAARQVWRNGQWIAS